MQIDSKELSFFNNKTVLITGAGGMLGRAFTNILKQYAPQCNLVSLAREELDVTNKQAVAKVGAKHKFDVVIHCAANVNADYCEQHEEECYGVQVTGVENVLEIAKASNAKFFYPQSFLIYGENDGIVDESTMPSPLSVYGKCKFEAEKLLLNNHSNTIIVRMGGFFGGEEKDKNFVGKFIPHIASLIKKGQPQQEIGHRIWQPTFTMDLAYNSLVLIARDKLGIYNMAAHGHSSFYELAKEVTKCLNIDSKIEIVPADGDAINKKDIARRPSKLIMQNKRLQSENLDFQRGWKESLQEYLNNPYFKNLFS